MEVLLILHNFIRWVVFLTGLWAVFGVFKNNPKGLRFYTISFDVQALLGIILWINLILSYGSSQGSMKEFYFRFFVMEHPVIMLLSLISAHLSVVKAKSEGNSWKVLAILSYILLIVGIPWWRPLIRI
ncbi:MAG: hypothetical protein ABIL16_04525 [candidate division WOR-3 bacterium]